MRLRTFLETRRNLRKGGMFYADTDASARDEIMDIAKPESIFVMNIKKNK